MEDQTTSLVLAGKPKEGDPWDCLIVGSGPSGLTAAIYMTRGAASTLILGGDVWGGQLMLTTEVDNFPGSPGILGPDLMNKMREHSVMFGAEFVERNAEEIDITERPFKVKADKVTYEAKTIILATGAETRWLGVPGEDQFRGRGVSSCAPCDAPFYKGKDVIVVGGGDSAMEEALVLTKYAKKVTIVHRRDAFKASEAMKAKVFAKAKEGVIDILWNTEIVDMTGDNLLRNVKLKTPEGEKDLPIDGVFIAIGHTPATDIFKGKIDLDEKGYIKKVQKHEEAEKHLYHMGTSVDGVFVAGDVHDYHYRQAITAAGFGCMAAIDALKYLDKPAPSW